MSLPSTVQAQTFASRRLRSSALRGRGLRVGRALLLSLFGAGGLLGACTLTSEDFEPAVVEGPALTPDAGSPPAPPPPVALSCSPACGPAEVCRDGACQALDAGAPACEGTDCVSSPPIMLVPTCDDGVANGDEAGADCGGSCDRACSAGQSCRGDADCAEGLFCPPGAAQCTAVSCGDGVQNGAEVQTDCGGGECAGCPDDSPCLVPIDCASGVCGADGTCSAPSCDDAVQNQDEAGVDCGGSCAQGCGTLAGCAEAGDCESGVCAAGGCAAGVAQCCQAPSCDDGVANGGEPVVDCGNAACGLCGLGSPCTQNAQCADNLCLLGVCAPQPSCTDGVRNGAETGTDCGGGVCPRCPDLSACTVPADCNNNNCDVRGICISCGDAVIDGTESDVDCGGFDPFCQRCLPGQRCLFNTDCLSGFCFNGFC